ncbi:MAG: LOW QUALITY PROTEIN: hypothetical protein J3R72DRAFT_459131 [Linnemannia gamsii]|nr:MAG: LOW QUALITY PROTEIN: hypothetical protein J3R72DRAFT_459131 [Linnemannia gamsii]
MDSQTASIPSYTATKAKVIPTTIKPTYPLTFNTRTTSTTLPTMDPTAPTQSNADDYIAFEESESDVEIDLSTAPPKKPVPKVPKHFRKSNAKVYDNISVYAPPDSNLIFRCSQKRANWYLSRNLARSLSPTSIHLNFAPAGQGHVNDPYHLEERENKCVICGQETAEAGATMLHVVPEQYRKWFPIKLKSHASHDIVVACPECNAQWDREAAVVRKAIVGLYKIPLEGVGWIKDHEAGLAKSAAGAVVADWSRLWQEHREKHASSTIVSDSEVFKLATPEEELSLKDSLTEQDSKKKKKPKVRKVNVIPRERMRVLETSVFDWWNNYYKARNPASANESAQQKRELDDKYTPGSSGEEDEPRKKLKPEDAGARAMDATLVGFTGSTIESSETDSNSQQAAVAAPRSKLPSDEIEIPSPPPGHATAVTREMIKAALDAQATFKAPDYREHGQLVMAQVMASSGEYHKDADETEETLKLWQEATPLKNAPEGWRDFIRTWRGEFLKRAKPKHLSSEWRIENRTDSK